MFLGLSYASTRALCLENKARPQGTVETLSRDESLLLREANNVERLLDIVHSGGASNLLYIHPAQMSFELSTLTWFPQRNDLTDGGIYI